MSATEKWKSPIPFLMINSVASSGVTGWLAFDQVACCKDWLSDHFLGCSHVAVFLAPISQISVRVIETYRLKVSSVDYQQRRWLLISTPLIIIYYQHICFHYVDLHSTQAVNSCTTFSSFCIPSCVSAKIEVSWMKPTCDDSCGQMRVSIRSWQYAAAFFSASPEKLHRPKFDCPLHFDILNIYQIRTGNFNARARHLPFASLLWWKSIIVYNHGFGMPHMRQARCVLQSTDVPWSLDLSFHYTRAKATCHVCRDKITLEFVPTNWSVSAKTNWIKCFVN